MINKKYLEQAYRIRKDFVSIDRNLLKISNKLERIHKNLEKAVNELSKISDNHNQYTTDESFRIDVAKHLKVFEDETIKANKLYIPLNESMEKLRKEEEELYAKLCEEYSNIPSDDIIKEIHNFIASKAST